MPSFEGNLLTQRHQNYLIRNSLGYHIVKTRSLYLTWAWFGTGSWHPWRTDRIRVTAVPAGTAVARKNHMYDYKFSLPQNRQLASVAEKYS